MEKKIFKEFVALFNALSSAGHLLAGYDSMRFNRELATDEKKQNEIKEQFKLADESSVMEALEKVESFNMDNLFDEIENNFYNHRDSINIYVTSILRAFIHIVPYYRNSQDSKKYGTHLIRCIEFLKSYYKLGKAYSECTAEQRYLLKTQELRCFFCSRLDALCLDFNVDIMKIQCRAKHL